MKDNRTKQIKIVGLMSIIIAVPIIYFVLIHAYEPIAFIISKGFTVGAACGIIIGATARERIRGSLEGKKILLCIALLVILFILGWFFYSGISLGSGIIYYIVGLACGTSFTLPIFYLVIVRKQ